MPLDSHSYLVSQGWSGKGTGLRQGAISRPLAIPQKKTLAGLGKDRDEAFPFWDHLFSAAAKSIQLKFATDDEDEVDTDLPAPEFKRTTTGILSNRRPATGVMATSSGTNKPDDNHGHQPSLLFIAKREAAKRNLYSRFFRGPVLGPDSSDEDEIVVRKPGETPKRAQTLPEIKLEKKTRKLMNEDSDGTAKKRQRREPYKKESKTAKEEADLMVDNEKMLRKQEKRRKKELKAAKKLSAKGTSKEKVQGTESRSGAGQHHDEEEHLTRKTSGPPSRAQESNGGAGTRTQNTKEHKRKWKEEQGVESS